MSLELLLMLWIFCIPNNMLHVTLASCCILIFCIPITAANNTTVMPSHCNHCHKHKSAWSLMLMYKYVKTLQSLPQTMLDHWCKYFFNFRWHSRACIPVLLQNFTTSKLIVWKYYWELICDFISYLFRF